MPRPNAILSGDEIAGVRIEYVKSRGVLRLSGWHARDAVVDPVEIPVQALLQRLGIEPADLAFPRQWLLFGGRDEHPRGGAADLLATFHDEVEARRAFQHLRQGAGGPTAWAELVVLDQSGRTRPSCWFGHRTAPDHDRPGAPAAAGAAAGAEKAVVGIAVPPAGRRPKGFWQSRRG